MVGEGDAWHSVSDGFVDKAFDGGLTVEEGELRVYVQVDEGLHIAVNEGELRTYILWDVVQSYRK